MAWHSILVYFAVITWHVVPTATSFLPAIEELDGAVWEDQHSFPLIAQIPCKAGGLCQLQGP
ncbi:hypothetical protein HaLaN_20489 [Haematococcus lacustris]|uniref:Uncharacterized protein n=1 Tax=Haematococcus lacustris TaxID=44745 RepID=A0A699ZTD5_HAELA|nr:hypothetical protein HaLaN_20489 [Haematococcus lacustris]